MVHVSFPCCTGNGEFFLWLIFEVPHIFSFENSKSNNLTAEVFFHDFVFIIEGCTLRAQIFADTNVCGNYFWDIGPKSWSWISRNIIKLAKSRKFAPRNTTKDYKSNTFFAKQCSRNHFNTAPSLSPFPSPRMCLVNNKNSFQLFFLRYFLTFWICPSRK